MRYLYRSWPSLLRSQVVSETANHIHLGKTEHFNIYTAKWEPAATYLTPPVTSVPRVELDDPEDPGSFWTEFDVRWIERRRREDQKQRREQQKLPVRWGIKLKGFQAYDGTGKRVGQVWARTAETALRKNPTVAYVEYRDRFGKITAAVGQKPKELKR
jgi:hypothetical protein